MKNTIIDEIILKMQTKLNNGQLEELKKTFRTIAKTIRACTNWYNTTVCNGKTKQCQTRTSKIHWINNNLEQQAQALFKSIYCEENNGTLADIIDAVETG